MSAARATMIFGPTASGKSALALALAEHFGGTIINADSMQVYRELSILTARPTPHDEARAPHALYGFVPAAEAYSAGRFVEDAARAIADARAQGRRPIVVGGTGLYFKALLEGLSPIPEVPLSVRAHWRAEAERLGPAAIHAVLAARDPGMAARLKPSDPQRIVRALEVLEASGRSLAFWQAQPGTPVIREAEVIRVALLPPREIVQARAAERFDAMMRAGGLDEAQALGRLGLPPTLPAMRALGVAQLIAAARGKVQLGAAVAQAKTDTKGYIKRQETWAKSNMIAWNNFYEKEKETLWRQIIAFIDASR